MDKAFAGALVSRRGSSCRKILWAPCVFFIGIFPYPMSERDQCRSVNRYEGAKVPSERPTPDSAAVNKPVMLPA